MTKRRQGRGAGQIDARGVERQQPTAPPAPAPPPPPPSALRRWERLLLPAVLFAAGALAGLLGGRAARQGGPVAPVEAWEVHDGKGFKYINPLLECESVEVAPSRLGIAAPFGRDLKVFAAGEIAAGAATHVSVYFRDLNFGPWFGIDEKEPFAPASMLKVPLLIAYLAELAYDPGLPGKRYAFDGPAECGDQYTKPSQTLVPGKEYTVEELLEQMIAHSDNCAMYLLRTNLRSDALFKVYRDLGVKIPGVDATGDYMTVKEYAAFFRVLYNGSYLSDQMSERALGYLARAAFKGGLVAGVPAGVPVAHKFGERSTTAADGAAPLWQLHDCGIVYYPGNPYLLCVMTRGKDIERLKPVVAGVSRIAWEGMEKKLKGPTAK